MTQNNKPYPQIGYRFSENELNVKVLVEAWVRLKRKGKYYLVLYSTDYVISKNSTKEALQEFFRVTEATRDMCERVRLLWRLPEPRQIKDMIAKGSLKICTNHQTNKEHFLTHLLIP